MAYRTLPFIHRFLHTVCSNVLRLPPVACRIDQHSFGSMVHTYKGMLEYMVFSFRRLLSIRLFPDPIYYAY